MRSFCITHKDYCSRSITNCPNPGLCGRTVRTRRGKRGVSPLPRPEPSHAITLAYVLSAARLHGVREISPELPTGLRNAEIAVEIRGAAAGEDQIQSWCSFY